MLEHLMLPRNNWLKVGVGLVAGIAFAMLFGRHTIIATTSPGAVWVMNDVTGSVQICEYNKGCSSPGSGAFSRQPQTVSDAAAPETRTTAPAADVEQQ
jgi:hypothetical protein